MPFFTRQTRAVCLLFLLAVAELESVQQRQVRAVAIGKTGFAEHMAANRKMRGITLDFGGSHHGVDSSNDEMRPEAVKMQVCDDGSKCQECTTQASCWRGYSTGKLKLDVPAGSGHDRYVAEMWARCAAGNGQWYVYVWKNGLQNGFLNIYVDGKLFKKATNDQAKNQNIRVTISKNTHVRVEFVRDEKKQASGYISLYANNIDQYVDDCMGVKDCLESLGDGSDNAFRFRNSNEKQLQCIDASSVSAQEAVSDHCPPWNTCLSKQAGRKDKLKTFLRVALTTRPAPTPAPTPAPQTAPAHRRRRGYHRRRGSLLAGDGAVAGGNADAPGCLHPEVEDPESWDCECMDEMMTKCGGLHEECFHRILCDNSNICDSWKGVHCQSSSLLATHRANISASQGQTTALMRRTTEMGVADNAIDDHLDTALSGKCAEQ